MKRIKLLLLMLLPLIGFSQVYVESIDGEQIIEHKAYKLSYNENCEQANWVYYVNTINQIRNDSLERGTSFRMDPDVKTKTASNRDYSKTGFDKGHLAPAADMLYDKDVVYEANYMSNISPQYPGLNRGPWLQLESRVREFSWFQDSVHVLVGPILTGDMETIGGNEVCIPPSYFKIIFYKQCDGVWNITCFIMPNQNFEESEKKPLNEYMVSLQVVEEKSGLNFKLD